MGGHAVRRLSRRSLIRSPRVTQRLPDSCSLNSCPRRRINRFTGGSGGHRAAMRRLLPVHQSPWRRCAVTPRLCARFPSSIRILAWSCSHKVTKARRMGWGFIRCWFSRSGSAFERWNGFLQKRTEETENCCVRSNDLMASCSPSSVALWREILKDFLTLSLPLCVRFPSSVRILAWSCSHKATKARRKGCVW